MAPDDPQTGRERWYDLTELAERWNRHPATFTRWILRGVRDPRTGEHIKLEAIRSPGRWLVPEGAVERFFGRVTAARQGTPAPTPAATTAARARHLARVDAELDRIGI